MKIRKTNYVEKRLIDKVSLWVLRMILNLGGHKDFVDKDRYFREEDLAHFLGLSKHLSFERSKYTRNQILNLLKDNLKKLENQTEFKSSKILSKNIAQVSSLMHLNDYEQQVLEFVTVLKQYDILEKASNLFGYELSTMQVKNMLSIILDIPKKEIEKMFASDSRFSKSSLVNINRKTNYSLESKLSSINNTFLDNLFNNDEDISSMLKDSIRVCDKSELGIKDYGHIKSDVNMMLSYLKHTIHSKKSGVNILLYGSAGTGKTELVKVLAKELKTKLFEVSYIDTQDDPIDGHDRLRAYKSAQALLTNQKTLLMYDEAEDIFESGGGLFSAPLRQKDKAWINKMLETNTIPTIWITNNINSVDNALIRRFDINMQISIPKKSKRVDIINKYSSNFLDKKSIKVLAENEKVSPALVATATKVVNVIKTKDKTKAFTNLINNTLKAQGYSSIKNKTIKDTKKTKYNPKLVNTTTDLKELAKGIKKVQSARICLYGVAGTGKSAFGYYLASKLKRPLILKKASDLMCKYIGGTEKNIADAFFQAKKENAILVFDEVDTFLADRTQARASWEISHVNELLVQMEIFDGIFIATTNLMDNLDSASLRRFDIKLEFKYLKVEQSKEMFKKLSKKLNLPKKVPDELDALTKLTLGDFMTVDRQSRFKPIKDSEDFLARLKDEVRLKTTESTPKMGFLNQRD